MSRISKIKVLIAPDKFRPKLTASQVCHIIQSQLSQKYQAKCIPLADGGQGSLEAIQKSLKCVKIQHRVKDPLFRQINAYYLYDKQSKTAYIQMAKASGQSLLRKEEKNPLKTSTFGTGELIKKAIQQGSRKIFLMIGGSATNQAGIGAAAALGYTFLDQKMKTLSPIGQNLQKIHKIREPQNKIYKNVQINVSTDVLNPLLGPNGATYVFGTQKGANLEALQKLQKGMRNLNNKFKNEFNKNIENLQGGGAAGGLGAGSVVFFNAKIRPGIKTITQIVKLKQNIKQADIIVTGQGKVDKQTIQGKLVKGVIDMTKQYNQPVIVFCGKSQIDQKQLGDNVRIFQNQRQGMSNQQSINNAEKLLRQSVRQYFI